MAYNLHIGPEELGRMYFSDVITKHKLLRKLLKK